MSEWRFGTVGTIRPRFGFSAVQNSCVCTTHHHHAYWRLDFDRRTAGNNLVREFNAPPLFGSSNWHDKNYEIRRPREPSRKRKWRVENKVTGEAYDIFQDTMTAFPHRRPIRHLGAAMCGLCATMAASMVRISPMTSARSRLACMATAAGRI